MVNTRCFALAVRTEVRDPGVTERSDQVFGDAWWLPFPFVPSLNQLQADPKPNIVVQTCPNTSPLGCRFTRERPSALRLAEVLSCSTIFKSSEEICRWFFHQARVPKVHKLLTYVIVKWSRVLLMFPS